MEAFREQLLFLVSTPLYVVLIGIELLVSHWRHTTSYTFKDSVISLYLMILNIVVDVLFRAIYLVILLYCWQHRVIDWQNLWFYWICLLLMEDLAFYTLHWVDHHVRFFWAVHVTHHSSEHYNILVGLRSSVFEPLYRFVYFIPLAFMGFQALDIIFIFSATQLWGVVLHMDHIGKLGWLEYIFVTPSHHRVHHASNPLYLDKNMGMFLIIWDKLFGTFQPELPTDQYEPIRFGLTKSTKDLNFISAVFHEWQAIIKDLRKSKTWRHRWRYLFGLPGWSHDGSSMTSEEMRRGERLRRL